MSIGSLCIKHNRELSIYDLTCHEQICERCALFEDTYRRHHFIEYQALPNFAQNICNKFAAEFQQIGLTNHSSIDWKYLRFISEKTLAEHSIKINNVFDDKIRKLEEQRKIKLLSTQKAISKIQIECKQAISVLLSQRLSELAETKAKLESYSQQSKFEQICKLMSSDKTAKDIEYIEKQLAMIKLELQQKLNEIDDEETLPAFLHKISSKEDNLMNNEEFMGSFEVTLDSKEQKSSTYISNCKTERSQNIFSSQELPIPMIRSSKAEVTSESAKKVTNKLQIKNIVIKNTVKQVNLRQLGLNDRQAIQAIRICSLNNFVTKIDLSCNELTHRFITQLKRDKPKSRYLKTITIKGIKLIDQRALKKEGIELETIKDQGKIQLGDLTLEY